MPDERIHRDRSTCFSDRTRHFDGYRYGDSRREIRLHTMTYICKSRFMGTLPLRYV